MAPGPAPAGKASLPATRRLVTHLQRTQIFRDYERAFRETTGLPLVLRPAESVALPHQSDPKVNPVCAVMAESNQTCATCLKLQQRLEHEAHLRPKTLHCFGGLCNSAVPVRVGEDLIAFLQTGQVLLHAPTKARFERATRELLRWGSAVDLKRLEDAYFQSRVSTPKQYESILRLLTIFAQHLGALSNQLIVQETAAESPAIAKARTFIVENHAGELSLGQVARAVNLSAFYFCKTFKRATGMSFTEFLARVRVEKVRHLLLDPHKRIIEAAYEAGFQSLSQFYRVFRRIAGEPPTRFRDRMQGIATIPPPRPARAAPAAGRKRRIRAAAAGR
jgi:AraC-like DNA-binding protein/ligand-binding sensor protein